MDTDAISHMYGRSEAAFKLLIRKASETQNVKSYKLRRKWSKLLASYHMDSIAIDDTDALNLLVTKTALKFGIPQDIVSDILDTCDRESYPTIDLHTLTASLVPCQLRTALVRQAGKEEYASLVTRYYPLLPNDGLFLSMDPRLLRALAMSAMLPVLECCGSPFNHCTDTYCSLFDEDEAYGALPRFDAIVDYISFPCRLLVNPPYTPASITLFIDKVLNYMRRQRGEFIFFLPVMHKFEPLDRLLAYPGTESKTLKGGRYTLYSFSVDKTITATMDLLVIANVASDTDGLLDAIVEHMAEYASCIPDSSNRERSKSSVPKKANPTTPELHRQRRVT